MRKLSLFIKSIFLFITLLNISNIYSQTTKKCYGNTYPVYGNYTGEVYFDEHNKEDKFKFAPVKSYVKVDGDSLFITIEFYDTKGKVVSVEFSRIYMKPMMQKIGPDTLNIQHPKNKGVYMLTIICPDQCGVQTIIKSTGKYTRSFDKTLVFFMDKKSADDFMKNW